MLALVAEDARKGARESGARTKGAIFFHRGGDWALFTKDGLRRLIEHLLRVDLNLGAAATARSLRRATVQWMREHAADPELEAAVAAAMGHSRAAWDRFYDVLGGERRLRTATAGYAAAVGGGAEAGSAEEESADSSSSDGGGEGGGVAWRARTRSGPNGAAAPVRAFPRLSPARRPRRGRVQPIRI